MFCSWSARRAHCRGVETAGLGNSQGHCWETHQRVSIYNSFPSGGKRPPRGKTQTVGTGRCAARMWDRYLP